MTRTGLSAHLGSEQHTCIRVPARDSAAPSTRPSSPRRSGTVAPADVRDDAKGEPTGQADCRKARCIALTFDAGPGKDTPRLLDILTEKQVPATFFLLGRKHVGRHPEAVRRIAAEGHEVAKHTWTHRIMTDLEPDGIRDEPGRTQEATERLTGRKPTLMRPPQGRADEKVSEASRELGLSQDLWSVTAEDCATADSDLIRQRTLDGADKDGIILLHDIHDGNVPAVPGIIDELKRRGFTFVTVPQLVAPAAPEPGTVCRP
ncbi:polysaccharide deacetylase family protein [Streptomyces sp. MUM 203J]|uniref:polysaccharide deacetylase family protein n=1 Tax=Streptomyces sp. MUM 203J TaxID=2791990 RepID=UPI001F04CA93|nr:polysaccharide deacetylase family protein [Streptomyces sp. MUM 203J]MCH0539211.1 polysaccharide deacetylase family protein [Streptomyces sp. MUM 203J]